MFFPFERAGEVLHAWAELLPSLPDELMTWASLLHFPDLPLVPEPVRGGSFAVVHGAFLGGDEDGRRELLAPVRDLGPAMDTFAVVPPIALGELAMDPPDPLPFISAHQLLGELPAVGVDDLLAAAGPGVRARRWRWSSCVTWAARSRAPSPAPARAPRCPGRYACSPSACPRTSGRRP